MYKKVSCAWNLTATYYLCLYSTVYVYFELVERGKNEETVAVMIIAVLIKCSSSPLLPLEVYLWFFSISGFSLNISK